MRKIRFGRTNVHVPVISLGTWGHGGPNVSEGAAVGWTGHDDREAKEALVEAHRRGISHWDTADAYGAGHAEQLIGEVFAEGVPRNEIFLATKFGWVKGPHDHYYDPGFMRAQCEQSLRNVRTDVIDLYYFHHCDFGPRDEYFDGALATMRRLRDEGKIRFIGLSDWDSRKIMRFIERVDPDVVQPLRNVLNDDYEPSGLKKWVGDHDLGVAFFSPLKHGLLLGKYDAPPQLGQNRLWAAEFFAGQLLMFDPDKKVLKEYPLINGAKPYTAPYGEPYSASADDKNQMVWTHDFSSGRLYRIDMNTGHSTEYLTPSEYEVRDLKVDTAAERPTVWVPAYRPPSKLVKMQVR